MFSNKNESAATATCSFPVSQFKERATNLLQKIEGIHEDIEQNKFMKFKNLLAEIGSVEESVDAEVKEQKRLYQGLLSKIKDLNNDVEEQINNSEKTAVFVKSRIETFVRTNEKAFERLKLERLETQDRLQKCLDVRIEGLLKKYPQIGSPGSAGLPVNHPLSVCKNDLSLLKTQIVQYFLSCEQEQQQVKEEIYSFIEQCSNLIKDKQLEEIQTEAIQYMRAIHSEVEVRLRKMGEQRVRMEEDVLCLLEKVVSAVNRGVSSFNFPDLTRQFGKRE